MSSPVVKTHKMVAENWDAPVRENRVVFWDQGARGPRQTPQKCTCYQYRHISPRESTTPTAVEESCDLLVDEMRGRKTGPELTQST